MQIKRLVSAMIYASRWSRAYRLYWAGDTEGSIEKIEKLSKRYDLRPDQMAFLATAYGRVKNFPRMKELLEAAYNATREKANSWDEYVHLYCDIYIRRARGEFNTTNLVRQAKALNCATVLKKRLPLTE